MLLPRRAFLGGAAATVLAGRVRAGGSSGVVALSWIAAQNLLALGVVPAASPEIAFYNRVVAEPAIPAGVRELGLRSEPNLELVASLRPDLLVFSGDLMRMQERLESIAPGYLFDFASQADTDRLDDAKRAMAALAERTGTNEALAVFLRTLDSGFADANERLRGYDRRAVFIVTILDGRRMLVFGKNSLFQSVLDRFGIENAWDGYTSRYGHATVSVDRLAARPDARLLCVGNERITTMERLEAAPVISSLPFVRERRIVLIPEVLFYGGLPSAHRFARLVSLALGKEGGR